MIEICPKNNCTGCSACANVCAHAAISMQPDVCGYVYPMVDVDKCTDCGLCQQSCPSLTLNTRYYPLQNLAVTTRDESDTLSCASGGAATLLSRVIVRQGGVVYGCNGTDIRNVHHIRVDNLDGIEQLKGSKYVQSAINNVYQQIRKDLHDGVKVLFIGTPCQVAGLYGFLHYKQYDKLFTADLVCHGVPSQKMLIDNIDLYTEIKGDECRVRFRNKVAEGASSKRNARYRITYGWFFENQPYVIAPIFKSWKKDPYMLGFISGLTLRPNCYECRYASIARVADFTLSDYWGLSKDAGFEKGKGVSNIIINTNEGKLLWEQLKNETVFKERPLMEALRGNGQLMCPSGRHPEHDRFVQLYPQKGFKNAVAECSKNYLLKMRMNDYINDCKRLAVRIISIFKWSL